MLGTKSVMRKNRAEMGNNMKLEKTYIITIVIMTALLLTACGNTTSIGDTITTPAPTSSVGSPTATTAPVITEPEENEAYYFEYNGIRIEIDAELSAVKAQLGEPNFFFEAESCAFEGKDRIYTYNGFELYTYTSGETEYIFSILFIDDSGKTPEGIGLGSSFEDMTAAYGENHTKEFEQYTYFKGNTKLSFLFEDGEVISVEYYLVQ